MSIKFKITDKYKLICQSTLITNTRISLTTIQNLTISKCTIGIDMRQFIMDLLQVIDYESKLWNVFKHPDLITNYNTIIKWSDEVYVTDDDFISAIIPAIIVKDFFNIIVTMISILHPSKDNLHKHLYVISYIRFWIMGDNMLENIIDYCKDLIKYVEKKIDVSIYKEDFVYDDIEIARTRITSSVIESIDNFYERIYKDSP
jgi:hypothetical protein